MCFLRRAITMSAGSLSSPFFSYCDVAPPDFVVRLSISTPRSVIIRNTVHTFLTWMQTLYQGYSYSLCLNSSVRTGLFVQRRGRIGALPISPLPYVKSAGYMEVHCAKLLRLLPIAITKCVFSINPRTSRDTFRSNNRTWSSNGAEYYIWTCF